jgi:hypothetical protein
MTTGHPTRFYGELDRLLQEKLGILSGIPLGLLEGANITTRDTKLLDLMKSMGQEPPADHTAQIIEIEGDPWKIISVRWILRPWKGMHGFVYVIENQRTLAHRVEFAPIDPTTKRLTMLLDTGALTSMFSLAEAESVAAGRLKEALTEHQWNLYNLFGCFFEQGKSGVTYIVRKGRPTLALRIEKPAPNEPPEAKARVNMLAALCLHPLGYYTGSWAGVLPPSDEALSHVCLIRADEHYFWRKAEQHALETPESGL